MDKKVLGVIGAVLVVALAYFGYTSMTPKESPVQKNNTVQNTQPVVTAPVNNNTAPIAVDKSNAQTSLDWNGTYKGKVPCASCEGIETTLVLNSNNTYSLAEKYIGGKSTGETFKESGSITWKGSVITLKDSKTAETRQFFVSENEVYMVGADGKVVTGPMAKDYTLIKVQ